MALTKVGKEGITGISNSSDATAITINSSENVGIGTSTITNTSNYRNIHIEGTNGTIMRFMANGTQVGQIQADTNEFQLNAITSDPMVFKTNNTERMRLLSSGGLTFNGDTAAANALNDYEEGTWTPTFFGSSTAGTYTYTTTGNSPYANYTKIGRTVTLQVMLNNITESSAGSGDVFVGGLPFDKVAGSAPFGCVNLNNWNTTGTITGVTVHPTTFANSGDKLQFTLDFDNTASNSLSLSHLKSGSSDVGFSLTYLTA